jgi:hypothetical protein
MGGMIRSVRSGKQARLLLRLLPLLVVLLCANSETRQLVSGALEQILSPLHCRPPGCVALNPTPADAAVPGLAFQPLGAEVPASATGLAGLMLSLGLLRGSTRLFPAHGRSPSIPRAPPLG